MNCTIFYSLPCKFDQRTPKWSFAVKCNTIVWPPAATEVDKCFNAGKSLDQTAVWCAPAHLFEFFCAAYCFHVLFSLNSPFHYEKKTPPYSEYKELMQHPHALQFSVTKWELLFDSHFNFDCTTNFWSGGQGGWFLPLIANAWEDIQSSVLTE